MNAIKQLFSPGLKIEQYSITVPNDNQICQKLEAIQRQIVRLPQSDQFNFYDHVQSKIHLNQTLFQHFNRDSLSMKELIAILGFYTFLLLNVTHQLVIYKLVSDSLLLNITNCQFYSHFLFNQIENEEISAYRVALIKAYVSRIDNESIKYMHSNQQFHILSNCISQLDSSLDFDIAVTCLRNCILKIVEGSQTSQQTLELLIRQEIGLVKFVGNYLSKINQNLSSISPVGPISKKDQMCLQDLQSMELFLIDFSDALIHTSTKEILLANLQSYLSSTFTLLSSNITHQHYHCYLPLTLRLLIAFAYQKPLIQYYTPMLPRLLNKLLLYWENQGCLEKEYFKRGVELVKSTILAIVIVINSKYCYLNRRGQLKESFSQELSSEGSNICKQVNSVITLMLSKQNLIERLNENDIRNLMLFLLNLCVDAKEWNKLPVLKLYMYYLLKFRNYLKDSKNWEYIVMHYESIIKHSLSGLLSYRPYISLTNGLYTVNELNSVMMGVECLRNYRYMLIEESNQDTSKVCLEKEYHQNFMSEGCKMTPGLLYRQETLEKHIHCFMINNKLRMPIVVLLDDQCFILAMEWQQSKQLKIILNIKFKNIASFRQTANALFIVLMGTGRQIQLEFNDKRTLKTLKQYLIQRKDRCREKELNFIVSCNEKLIKETNWVIESIN